VYVAVKKFSLPSAKKLLPASFKSNQKGFCMSGFTEEQLAALAATIDTIIFKSEPIESVANCKSSIPKSNNEILEILVTENPDIKFDLYDSGLSWPICDDFPFSEHTLGITLDTDAFIDYTAIRFCSG